MIDIFAINIKILLKHKKNQLHFANFLGSRRQQIPKSNSLLMKININLI